MPSIARRISVPRLRLLVVAVLLVTPSALQAGDAIADAEPARPLRLTIEEAVSRAISASYRIARAERSQEIASLRGRATRAGRLPKMSVGLGLNQAARGTYQATPTYTREQGLTGDFRTGLNVAAQMPIDVSGALGRQVQQSQITRQIAELETRQARIDVSFEVRAAYIAALRAQQAVTVEEQAIAAIERLIKLGDAGSQPFLAVELSAARQALETSQANADVALDGLRQWLRVAPEVDLILTSPLDAPSGDIASDRLDPIDDRPDIRQAKLRVDQAKIGVKQAGDSRRPSMALNAYFNQAWTGESAFRPDEGRTRDQGGVIALNLPLYNFDWGQTDAARRIARVQEAQARSDLDEQQDRAAYELRQAKSTLGRSEARLRALPDEKEAAAALRQAEQAFRAADGEERRSLLAQVTNARSAWRQARLSALGARADRAVALLRVARALGQDTPAGPATESVHALTEEAADNGA